ncbi:GatB/YqeY domain-containing protein [Hoeflea prorocentri]|uniref:GatB/YqeY domain-containing protein n=1 Tax=Hoeflea prorocentri TaxID=1922333 RepID=A0A9X3ZGC3_9HYPH|nr:GatB/YqeY domain-containing protein [Hoeflea prorocentri]MCY6379590.1 GatB/YqeY domain-containing protein [Hoeflea prorocentri]MDA5397390.1 GatB/YqeY domain-containing protein [Hoeflea prorocentri]
MREMFASTLREALKAKDTRRVSTIRLIQAAVKDRDIANRGAGKDPVCDDDIMQILAKMIKQREESARIYEDASRLELAQQEREEIDVIRSFLPQQLSDDDVRKACKRVVEETGASGLRDMGKCMNALKSEYSGQMDFAKASGVVKGLLHHE